MREVADDAMFQHRARGPSESQPTASSAARTCEHGLSPTVTWVTCAVLSSESPGAYRVILRVTAMKMKDRTDGRGGTNGPRYGTPFARWFRYPAGFSVGALNACFDKVGADKPCIIDPFTGVATGGVSAAARGHQFLGIEAHPEIAELARLKFNLDSDPTELTEAAKSIIEERGPLVSTVAEPSAVLESFTPAVLSELIRLREAIKASNSPWRDHLKWALLGTLRDVASSAVSWPYQRPKKARKPRYVDPVRRFEQRVSHIADDLRSWDHTAPEVAIVTGDSRSEKTWKRLLSSGMAPAASISSPPYLNNFDYADATRLELYFWGAATTWGEMVEKVRADMMLAATHQTTKLKALEAAERLQGVAELDEVLEYSALLKEERRRRRRGKEYDQLILCYFDDLVSILTNLHQALPDGAPAAWVVGDSAPYGIYVDTPRLIIRAAESVGFESVDDVILRSRGMRWRTNGSRHQVALTERMIVFRTIK